MPTFYTFETVVSYATRVRNFRAPNGGETETQYKEAFADFMKDTDPVEAAEIIHSIPGCNHHSQDLLILAFSMAAAKKKKK